MDSMNVRTVVLETINHPIRDNNKRMSDLAKEAMEFVKNNCITWCNFEGCSERQCEKLKDKNMFTQEELKDIRRALIIAMQFSDDTNNKPDIKLSDRLELIEEKILTMTS